MVLIVNSGNFFEEAHMDSHTGDFETHSDRERSEQCSKEQYEGKARRRAIAPCSEQGSLYYDRGTTLSSKLRFYEGTLKCPQISLEIHRQLRVRTSEGLNSIHFLHRLRC